MTKARLRSTPIPGAATCSRPSARLLVIRTTSREAERTAIAAAASRWARVGPFQSTYPVRGKVIRAQLFRRPHRGDAAEREQVEEHL